MPVLKLFHRNSKPRSGFLLTNKQPKGRHFPDMEVPFSGGFCPSALGTNFAQSYSFTVAFNWTNY